MVIVFPPLAVIFPRRISETIVCEKLAITGNHIEMFFLIKLGFSASVEVVLLQMNTHSRASVVVPFDL